MDLTCADASFSEGTLAGSSCQLVGILLARGAVQHLTSIEGPMSFSVHGPAWQRS